MNETTQTSTTPEAEVAAPVLQPQIDIRDLLASSNEMTSFFGDPEIRSFLNPPSRRFFNTRHGIGTQSAAVRAPRDGSGGRMAEIMAQMMTDNASLRADTSVVADEASTFRAPPLERVRVRRPDPLPTDTYVPRTQTSDFDGDTFNWTATEERQPYLRVGELGTISAAGNLNAGGGGYNIDAEGGFVSGTINTNGIVINNNAGQAVWGTIGSSNLSDSSEKALIKFLKEKLTLNVSLSQLSAGIELKVSLNLADTDETILSAEDFVRLD